MLQHYFQTAIRHLLKYKTQNLISIVGLAVCLLCFSICMYCSRFFLSIDQCFENHDHIADIVLKSSNGEFFSGTPATVFEQLQDIPLNEVDILTHIANADPRPYNIEMKDGKEYPFTEMSTIEIDSCFRQVFTPKIIAGSWDVAVHTPNAIIMMESTARKVFGENGDPIGKRMVLTKKLMSSPDATTSSGGTVYTIQAIIKDIPQNNSLNFCNRIDLLVLNDSEGLFQSESRKFTTGCSTFALLHKGKSVQQLEDHLRELNLSSDAFPDNTICATALGKGAYSATFSPYFISVTTALGILILLIGLLNFFHFLTGSFLNRSREYSLRKVLGSSNHQLLSQLFIQSALIILLAFLITFCLIELLAPFFHLTLVVFTLEIDKTSLMKQCSEYLILIFLLNLLICTLTVAYTHRISIQEGIKGNVRRMSKHFIRNTMLCIQFFICWIFVTLAASLYLQTEKTTSTLFGTLSKEEKECILSIPLNYTFMKNEEKLAITERIAQHSGVQEKLLSNNNYAGGISITGFQSEENNRDSNINSSFIYAAPNFFHFMNIPLLKGNNLQNNTEMVIDDVLEKRIPKPILGNILYNFNGGYTVKGITSSFITNVYFQSESLFRSEGMAFLPLKMEGPIEYCYIKCLPAQVKAVEEYASQVLREALPYTLSPQISTLQQDLEEIQGLESKMKNIILFFAIVSVIITLLGVYSAITLDTEHRCKEVAIRKVNGAGLWQILYLFLRMYVRILIITAVIAFPLLYTILQLWKQMYIVFFDDGFCFWICIFIGIVLMTLLTVIFRILKIAKINPVDIIKTE